MPRPKAVKSYPTAYLEYAEALSKDPTLRFTIEFDDERQAKNFRLDFNSFKGAAIREELTKLFPEIAAFHVEVQGNKAIVQHKDHTEQAVRMRKALREAQMSSIVKGGSV